MLPETTTAEREELVRREHRDLVGHSLAVYNTAETHRYLLLRDWAVGSATRTAVFVMLNPSTATETQDDPTIRRCVRYARREGCDVLAVVNLFAFRATDPVDLLEHPDPVGPRNDEFIIQHCAEWLDERRPPRLVVAAWGVHGTLHGRAQRIAKMLTVRDVSLRCLGVTKDGHPRHPLYVPADALLVPYRP